MEIIRVGVIGLGARGLGNIDTLLKVPDIEITAVCDVYEDRCDEAVNKVLKDTGKKIFFSKDYANVLERNDIDAIMIFTSWESHIKIAIDAMNAGFAVAMEVGGAYDVNDCFNLVKVQEDTKKPFMLLENCCYNKEEMFARNMAFDGMFGEIVHCRGAYGHDLRKEICEGKEKRHYRLRNYINRNCDNYPTHDLGPIAKILGVNRGNKMLRLVSVSSKAVGLNQYIFDRKDTIINKDLLNQKFLQGDIINTLITCENGETISLCLDTSLPRSYDRQFLIRGTKGSYEASNNLVFLDGDKDYWDTVQFYKQNANNAKKYEDKYLPDCWKNVTDEILESGHGGMDYFEFQAFFKALRDGEKMPIDVYDAAAWMSISCLSEKSISGGNIPVEVPDFTDGQWKFRPRKDV